MAYGISGQRAPELTVPYWIDAFGDPETSGDAIRARTTSPRAILLPALVPRVSPARVPTPLSY
jgi:hypothetical protein